jgi:hypothetical protein
MTKSSSNPKDKTVRIALPNKTFKPKPIRNICINGTNKSNAGMLKIRLSVLLFFE